MITKKIQLLFSILLLTAITFAQVNVNVNIKRPIPTKVSAWEQDPSIIQLILQNTTQQSYNDAYISIKVEDESGAIIGKTETGNPSIPTFTIPAGPPSGSGVLTLTGHDVVDMNAFDIDDAVQSSITTTNQLPEGYYEFCFTLLDSDGNPIGMPETNCVTIEILHPEPPALISPVNETVMAEYPQFIWAPVVGASPEQLIRYRITIAPRFEGQNIRTAVEANRPLVENFIQSTTYQYTPSDLPFETYSDAVDYVWQVQALDFDNEPVGTNQGKSEIAFFKFEEEMGLDPPIIPIDSTITIINPPITVFPTVAIKGQVRWMLGDPQPEQSGGGGDENSGGGNGFNPGTINPNQPVVGDLDFTGITYPIKETQVKVYTAGFPRKLIGTATTDDDGNFEVSFTNLGTQSSPAVLLDGYTYDVDEVIISPQEPHFEFPNNRVDLSSGEDNDLSAEIVYGHVKTYNFEPRIVDSETGETISDGKVELLRWPKVYEMYPTLEAELPSNAPLVKWHNNKFKLYNTVSSGDRANLTIADNVFAGAYYLKVYAEGYDTLYSAVVNKGTNYDFDSKPLVEKTYRLTSKRPIVEGKIVREDNLEPLSGLSVKLIPQGSSSPRYSTTTDDDGNFLISEIQPEADPYTLKVTGNKINEYTEELYLTQRGIKVEKYPLKIKAVLYAVKGKIVDDDDQPISNARLIWKSGGNPFYSDDNGNFFTMSPPETELF
ncbi:MAG: carboxypeptidase-like regulatory domain-containing protein [Melioribacteraceae bacterium]|nr:carboxypeptidase-like regulatory domain-containing protein [Melioribacteraceae bacterium]